MKYKDFKTMSQNEMKNVKGGSAVPGGGTCSATSECISGSKCASIGNLPKICMAVTIGTSCTSNDDCGNGQSCATNNTGGSPAHWCVTGV